MRMLSLIFTSKKALHTVAKIIRFTGRELTDCFFKSRQKTDFSRRIEMRMLSLDETNQQKYARRILGDDFLSLEEVSGLYGVSYSEAQREALLSSLPNSRTLGRLREKNCILLPTLPTQHNIHEFRVLVEQPHFRRREEWYLKPSQRFFRKDVVMSAQWLMMPKKSCPLSFHQTWKSQLDFLITGEYIPNAAEVVYALTTYHKVRGVCCLYKEYVRTSSVDETGNHVIAGDTQADGVNVCAFRDNEHADFVGILPAQINVDATLEHSILELKIK